MTKTAIRKIRGLTVLSFVGKCPCGKEIPYGQRACRGHGKWGKRRFQVNDKCSNCGRQITMRKLKRRDGTVTSTRPLIHYNKDNKSICHGCKCKEWVNNNIEYVKLYRKVYWYEKGAYFNRQARIKASIKRGYWVKRID